MAGRMASLYGNVCGRLGALDQHAPIVADFISRLDTVAASGPDGATLARQLLLIADTMVIRAQVTEMERANEIHRAVREAGEARRKAGG